ncbi:DUF1918 domain-containing protein [Streptomyces sp. ST2-7A]|uniref:DUF1918 domain-containing protein n=1 Tax=Streptomyces sp. ST2-7A TaxID=2907214 RepID=UPI001F369278|nr:DUF1918 domain-containing protein [Streptomyces sp. ST2-7A]MCE7082578.1 DUF1918 domain-containing protein [Streptomyces sp. ST2-7A]
MRAHIGDRVITHGRTVGRPDRVSEIIEVLGDDGGPPYRVRDTDGHETLLYPGPDSVVEDREDAHH